ncbi:MAG: AI-2E family transporter [Acutalibacteraceae bacterium]|nr:AI-2E family transporter [Acutalibacteraceae bacterium]
MKNNQSKKYIQIGLTIFTALAASILLYFILDRLPSIGKIISFVLEAVKPLIYGAVIAYVLYPVCIFFERLFGKIFKKAKNRKIANKITRGLSIFLSLIFGIGVIVIVLYMVIPQLYESISKIVASAPAYIEKIYVFVDNWFSDNDELRKSVLDAIDKYTSDITSLLTDWSGQIGNVVKSIGDGVLSVFIVTKNIFIGVIVAIYLLADRHQFKEAVKRFINLIFKNNVAVAVKNEIKFANDIILNFISGRILDSAIVGILCYILMVILQLPFPLLIAVLIGVTNIIPFFGPFIGAIPAGFLILIEDPIKCIVFVVMIIILQQVDGNIIGPKIVGGSIGLSSFWVLFAILLFSGIFGITGMLIGVPLFAIIYDIIKKSVEYFEEKKKLKESENK